MNTSATSVRVWYTNNQLGNEAKFQPAAAAPVVLVTGTGEAQEINYEFQTAQGEGYAFTQNLTAQSFTLKNMTLNKTGSIFGLEFLKKIGDTYYVIAYANYQGPASEALSRARIRADATLPMTVLSGRACGGAGQQIAFNAGDAAFRNACP